MRHFLAIPKGYALAKLRREAQEGTVQGRKQAAGRRERGGPGRRLGSPSGAPEQEAQRAGGQDADR